ncbi:hypothetical protein E4U31_004020 [Claviceps sp. LM219 group G6]|nr:hypothetical protein E4U14_003198 [Claviceps sp. LM454 group G7]KAG6111859.1 hypothetical protein E4U31_004020 [Claviceps sp. LM219 group G6]
MPSPFEREIYYVALSTILYWAFDTDDLDDTDDLADYLEEVLLAYCLKKQKKAENNPAINEDTFENEIYYVALCAILYWAVHTDDLDDTDELADFLEECNVIGPLTIDLNLRIVKRAIGDRPSSRVFINPTI